VWCEIHSLRSNLIRLRLMGLLMPPTSVKKPGYAGRELRQLAWSYDHPAAAARVLAGWDTWKVYRTMEWHTQAYSISYNHSLLQYIKVRGSIACSSIDTHGDKEERSSSLRMHI
jgi:hypothetical protein